MLCHTDVLYIIAELELMTLPVKKRKAAHNFSIHLLDSTCGSVRLWFKIQKLGILLLQRVFSVHLGTFSVKGICVE